MDAPSISGFTLGGASKRLAHRMAVVCENRLELLLLELQQEREHLLRAILTGLAAATCGLLAGAALTALIVVALWDHSPVWTLSVLTVLYAAMAGLLYARLVRGQREAQLLPASLDQLRKDRASLEHNFP